MRDAWSSAALDANLLFVVPVRESEAWALVDGDALRRVLGVSWSDAELGLPTTARRVADDPDPKRTLRGIVARMRGRRVDFNRLGDLISLTRLAEVTAFQQWTRSVITTMEHELGMTRAPRKGPR